MRVLIAGGAGFIGGHLVDHFKSRGDTVTVYDRILEDNGPHQWGRLIQETKDLFCAMQDQDLVVHLASNADIAKAVAEPSIDFYEGTLLTSCILEAMRKVGVKKLVYASGSGVYGEYHGVPFKETDPTLPTSPYGASKLAGEAMIRAYCHMFGMRADIFRFANVVGPRQTHGVGYDFIRKLRADPTRLEILGDGTQDKSYVHVSDVVTAIDCSLRLNHNGCEVYNVATDDGITVTEIAALASHVCGAPYAAFQYSGGDRGWKGDIPRVRLDTTRIRSLGWEPALDSHQAVIHALKAMVKE